MHRLAFSKDQIWLCILAGLAIALQFQTSFFVTESYQGLRLNAADILLPFIGLYVAGSLLLKKSHWPHFSLKATWPWLAALLLVMSVALIKGYISNGFWSHWAVVNKYIGFITLLCYFLLGGWISTNKKAMNANLLLFTRVFCGTYITILTLSFLCATLDLVWDIPFTLGKFTWDGFMANRNAFMVLGISVMVFIETYRFSGQPLFPPWVYALFWLITPTFVLYNESRTGWIIGGIILLTLLIKGHKLFLKKILPYLLIGSVLASVIYINTNVPAFEAGWHMRRFKSTLNQEYNYGDKVRRISHEDGWEFYLSENPILGGGLGTYQEFQIEKRGEFIDIVDWSALWLLGETGALGLLIFSLFFLAVALSLYRKSEEGDENNIFTRATLYTLIVIAAMSFLHELLYTRFLWLFLGLALAMPYKNVK